MSMIMSVPEHCLISYLKYLNMHQFDLELWYKVFFCTYSCRLDIAIKDSG